MYILTYNIYLLICITDQNIDGAEGAMKTARSIVEYFEKSSQAKNKLLAYQKTSNIAMHQNQSMPLKVFQYVKSWWWSTWRMLGQLKYLKISIG